MKLKYYLRGIGIGVLVATFIMTVSSVVHNNNLSDDFIIKEAQKLGMIMSESEDDKDSLWGNSNTEKDTQTDNHVSSEQLNDDTQVPEAESTEEDLNTENQVSSDEQVPPEEERVVIQIRDGEGAGSVARKLYSLGVIENEEDFHAYLKNSGYSRKIRCGSFEVIKGASYEEICDVIIRK